MTEPHLSFSKVTFSYGFGRKVFCDCDKAFEPGTVTLLAGPNGSGKTTMLRLAAGVLRPDSGQVKVHGKIVFVPSQMEFHESLTVTEELRYLAACGSLNPKVLAYSTTRWGVDSLPSGSLLSDLSTGWRQRLSLAVAEAVGGGVVLLDEPMANLDSLARRLVETWIARLTDSGAIVVLAQHGEYSPSSELATKYLEFRLADAGG